MLTKNDPPPYQLINTHGQGNLILVADHASNQVPAFLRNLGLNKQALESHIAWDPGAALQARAMSILTDSPLILSNYSRLVIDCNRDPESQESIINNSDKLSIPGNQKLSADEKAYRRKTFFDPYHQAIAELIESRRHKLSAIVSIHSFTPLFRGSYRPWKIGVCYGEDSRLAKLILNKLMTKKIYSVGDNAPYSIDKKIDYTLPHHASSRNIAHVMLEFRNDVLGSMEDTVSWGLLLAEILDEIKPQLSAFNLQSTECA